MTVQPILVVEWDFTVARAHTVGGRPSPPPADLHQNSAKTSSTSVGTLSAPSPERTGTSIALSTLPLTSSH